MKRPIPLQRDFRIIGCAWCQLPASIGDRTMPYQIPAPWASFDARDDVRMHMPCYREFIFGVWALLGFAPIPDSFMS